MEHNSFILKLSVITADTGFACTQPVMQLFEVYSLIRCRLVTQMWWEPAGNMYVHTYNYECVSKLKNRAHYSLFLEGRYLSHTMALWKNWHSSCNKKAVVFLPEYSRVTFKAHTHRGLPNGEREASERVKQCQSVVPLMLLDKRCCLKIVNSTPDPRLVKWDRKTLNKTALSGITTQNHQLLPNPRTPTTYYIYMKSKPSNKK